MVVKENPDSKKNKTPLVIETITFTIESSVFQNSHLNGAPSISDIKLPWEHVTHAHTLAQ